MRHLVVSRCVCVEAGELDGPGSTYSVFPSLEAAREKQAKGLQANLQMIQSQIKLIRASETLQFSAPYIVYALILELPIDCGTAKEATEYLAAAGEDNDLPTSVDQLPYKIVAYDGSFFDADDPSEWNSITKSPDDEDAWASEFPIERAMEIEDLPYPEGTDGPQEIGVSAETIEQQVKGSRSGRRISGGSDF